MSLNFFDMLAQICYIKSDIDFDDPEIYKAYDIYMINRYLSMVDAFIPFVFSANKAILDKPSHYRFFKSVIKQGRYDFNYLKKVKDEETEEVKKFLCKYYEIGMKEACEYFRMLSRDKIDMIINIYKYGKNGKQVDDE
jgi:hypothetical protein